MNKYAKLVANNKKIQKAVLTAMFDGCERGTDIWEYIGGDYPNHIFKMLYGLSKKDNEALNNIESFEEEREILDRTDYDCLYNGANAAAVELIDAVKVAILYKMKIK